MKQTTSKFAEVRNSKIHGKGIFAKIDIPKNSKVIEYVGEKVTKKESDRRFEQTLEKSEKDNSKGEVYLFELDDEYDIDGDISWNTAKWINHSCEPNCETEIEGDKIWIVSTKDIKKGEEICYNYGFGWEEHEDYPCKCGTSKCVGYILDEEQWHRLKKKTD